MVGLTEQIVRGKTRVEHLDEVKSLNLWGQDIDDVSVLLKMPGVEVLSLSVNRIASLRDFRHCVRLQELYLRKNSVASIHDLQYLIPMTDLKILWLCENPCADHPLYRQLVAALLPSVEKLDNTEITPQDCEAARRNPDVAAFVTTLSRGGGGVGGEGAGAGGAPDYPTAVSPQQQVAQQVAQLDPFSGYGGGGMLPRAPSRPQSKPPPSPPGALQEQPSGGGGIAVHRSPSAGDAPGQQQRRRKNVLYAVMALITELDDDDLVYVRREIEQRMGSKLV